MRTKDVDAHDEADAQTTEIAVATAVAAVLAHPPDVQQMTAERAEAIMESAVGMTLRFYAQRVLQLFITDWHGGFPTDAEDYAIMTGAIDGGVRRAIDYTGESVREVVRAAAEDAASEFRNPTAGPITFEQGLTTEEQAYRRLTNGMNSMGRILVTRAREEAKASFATRAGAIGKAWRTRRDSRVRVSHGDLEGDFVPMDGKFVTIRGAKLDRPGDPTAPLSETINCRCRLSYRMPL